jgi:hypothetical protein
VVRPKYMSVMVPSYPLLNTISGRTSFSQPSAGMK